MYTFKIVLSLLFIVPGAAMVFAANWFVKKYGMADKSKVNFEHEMTGEELEHYKFSKAVVNFKMLGMLVALPGFILIILLFR